MTSKQMKVKQRNKILEQLMLIKSLFNKSKMQQQTYFQPQSKKVVINKKHFAFILLAYWLLFQFFSFVIYPSGIWMYQSLFVEGSLKVYWTKKHHEKEVVSQKDQNKQKLTEDDKSSENGKSQQLNAKDRESNSQSKLELNDKSLKNRQKKKINEQQNESKETEQKLSETEPKSKKNDEFKIKFKIKGKGKNMEQLKQKVAQQSLKIAMQEYLFKKGQHSQM